MNSLINKIVRTIRRGWHDIDDGHVLSGFYIAGDRLDMGDYPYCVICGGRPKESFLMKWFYQEHTHIRNKAPELFDKLSKYDMEKVLKGKELDYHPKGDEMYGPYKHARFFWIPFEYKPPKI